jgi:hypothetical protein
MEGESERVEDMESERDRCTEQARDRAIQNICGSVVCKVT